MCKVLCEVDVEVLRSAYAIPPPGVSLVLGMLEPVFVQNVLFP